MLTLLFNLNLSHVACSSQNLVYPYLNSEMRGKFLLPNESDANKVWAEIN